MELFKVEVHLTDGKVEIFSNAMADMHDGMITVKKYHRTDVVSQTTYMSEQVNRVVEIPANVNAACDTCNCGQQTDMFQVNS